MMKRTSLLLVTVSLLMTGAHLYAGDDTRVASGEHGRMKDPRFVRERDERERRERERMERERMRDAAMREEARRRPYGRLGRRSEGRSDEYPRPRMESDERPGMRGEGGMSEMPSYDDDVMTRMESDERPGMRGEGGMSEMPDEESD